MLCHTSLPWCENALQSDTFLVQTMWTVAKRLAQASAIGAIGTAGYAKWLVQTEPDNPLSRTFKFWTNAFPIFLHYRVVDAMYPKQGAERDAAFELLHEDYSNRILNTMIDLRGFYIKIGQVFATRADILPRVWVERMQKLEDAVPPRSMDIVRQVIEAEIGKPMESLFVEFDPKPLGSASIGQVHRAKLHNGDVVAVKVQFEEAEGLFRGDIQNMKRFCEVAQPEQVVVFEEIERQFMTEFDYRCEAANLNEVRANVKPFADKVAVPFAYPEYSTRKVLVMEYLNGVKLITAVRAMFEKLARLSGKTLKQIEEEAKNAPKPATTAAPLSAAKLQWLARLSSLQMNIKWWVATVYNTLLGNIIRLPMSVPQFSESDSIAAFDYRDIVETLIRVHAHTLMVNGVFNGDPHPGNILLLKDGRIGLIDYGQTKRLTDEQRLIVARCFLALAQHDGERLVNYALSTGATWKRNDPYVIEKTATAFLDRDDPIVTNGKNLQLFFEDMHNRDPAVTTSNFFIMVGRMSILLRAITYAFNSPVSFATISRPITEQVLLKEGNDQDKKWASFKGLHPTGLMKDYPPL